MPSGRGGRGTAAEVAHAWLPKKRSIDGVNLLPYLKGEEESDPHADLFWRLGKRAALRQGDWKITRSSPWMNAAPKWELYNLAEDIAEKKDLAKSNPEQLKKLVTRFEELNSEMIDPIWSPQ